MDAETGDGRGDDEGLSAVRDGDSVGGEAMRTLHVEDLGSKDERKKRREEKRREEKRREEKRREEKRREEKRREEKKELKHARFCQAWARYIVPLPKPDQKRTRE